MDKQFNVVEFIMDYESGNVTDEEFIGGFQHLLNSGLVWSLQGHYGRTARILIDAGIINSPEESNE